MEQSLAGWLLAVVGVLAAVIIYLYKERQAADMRRELKDLNDARIRDFKDVILPNTVAMTSLRDAVESIKE